MAAANQTPEQKARDRIDDLLTQAGWIIQPKNKINLNAGLGVAVREYQTNAAQSTTFGSRYLTTSMPSWLG